MNEVSCFPVDDTTYMTFSSTKYGRQGRVDFTQLRVWRFDPANHYDKGPIIYHGMYNIHNRALIDWNYQTILLLNQFCALQSNDNVSIQYM